MTRLQTPRLPLVPDPLRRVRTIRRATVGVSHMELDLSLGLPIGFSMG